MPCHDLRMAIETLEDVLALGHEIVEIVVQDEYTHAVVARAPHGFVVIDTT